ncbi:hypothetical protein L9F63_021810, partial [Diploptera punctata]
SQTFSVIKRQVRRLDRIYSPNQYSTSKAGGHSISRKHISLSIQLQIQQTHKEYDDFNRSATVRDYRTSIAGYSSMSLRNYLDTNELKKKSQASTVRIENRSSLSSDNPPDIKCRSSRKSRSLNLLLPQGCPKT